MRIVLDTNVLISGLMLPDSTPGKIVTAWRRRNLMLITSEALLDAIGRVLNYSKIRKRLQWDEEKIARFITLLRFETEIAQIKNVNAQVPADADDEHLLAALIASQADWLVTGDKDFDELTGQYPIITPGEFARRYL